MSENPKQKQAQAQNRLIVGTLFHARKLAENPQHFRNLARLPGLKSVQTDGRTPFCQCSAISGWFAKHWQNPLPRAECVLPNIGKNVENLPNIGKLPAWNPGTNSRHPGCKHAYWPCCLPDARRQAGTGNPFTTIPNKNAGKAPATTTKRGGIPMPPPGGSTPSPSSNRRGVCL